MNIPLGQTVAWARSGFGAVRRKVAIMSRFFRKSRNSQTGLLDELDTRIWNPRDNTDLDSVDYESALLEQYRLYAELADRVSQRRGNTNTYFLSLNGAALVAISGPWATRLWATAGLAILQLVFLLGICISWHLTVRSHRQLSKAKWDVVCVLEQRLPAAPWSAEWNSLGGGKDRQRYWKLTSLEQWAPVLFGAAYVAAFVISTVS